MAAAYVLTSTDCWTRSANGLSTTRCPLNAPVEYSLQYRLSLVALAWVVQTSQQHVCYAIIHQLLKFKFTHHFSFLPSAFLAVFLPFIFPSKKLSSFNGWRLTAAPALRGNPPPPIPVKRSCSGIVTRLKVCPGINLSCLTSFTLLRFLPHHHIAKWPRGR